MSEERDSVEKGLKRIGEAIMAVGFMALGCWMYVLGHHTGAAWLIVAAVIMAF